MIDDAVAIIGAGIGGLAAALALSRRGIAVTVYEQAAQLGEIGAGLHLSPNGMKVMRALDLEPALAACAARPRSICTRHYATSEANFEGPLDADFEARFGAPFYSFHRADLHGVLSSATAGQAGIRIVLGRRLETLLIDDQGARLGFADGSSAIHRAVIGADGVHSIVRQHQHGDVSTRFTGHVAYRGMAATAQLPDGFIESKLNVWVGPGKHVVAYPVRRGELINYVAIIEEDGWSDESWTTRADARTLDAAFEAWHDTVRTLVGTTISGECYKWALLGRDPLPSWSGMRSTLLGDAAHPMVPYLAQGAVMAVEDAWVLAACLGAFDDLAEALQRYELARLARTSAVQAAAWEQGQKNHAVGRDKTGDEFRGGSFADPAWIYGHDVVVDFP